MQKVKFNIPYSTEYLEQWWSPSNITGNSSDANLALLLGVQGWRSNAFDLSSILNVSSSLAAIGEEELELYDQLYGTVLTPPRTGQNSPVMAPMFVLAT